MRILSIITYTLFLITTSINPVISDQPSIKTTTNDNGYNTKPPSSPQELVIRFRSNTPFAQIKSFCEKIKVEAISPVFSPKTPGG